MESTFKTRRIVCLTFCISMLSILFYACSGVSNNHRRQVRQEVETFAQAYFNFNFSVALDHCSKESGRWIRFAASNITAEDIAQLQQQQQEATVEIGNYELKDSTGHVNVTVRHFMQFDSIGGKGHLVDEATFRIPVCWENGKWTVRMEGPLRSETSGRDSDGD